MRSKTMRSDQGAGLTNRPGEDLPSASRPGLTRRHQPGEGSGRLAQRWLVLHLGLYLMVNGFFTVTWLLAPDVPGVDERFWPAWIMLLLAVPLGLHATVVSATRASRRAAVQQPARVGRALATVLFTDIVASTERAQAVGDRRWGELLDAHDRLARELVVRFGGRLVKSTGDGLLATFDRPGHAIRCATALRHRLHPLGVEIRAGLHTGEVQVRGADVGGIAVHVAARVMAAAGAGEVLVSRTVHDLVAGSDLVLEDRGTHTLRGMAGQWQLFAVRG
jgi:class 3 adenylate cyclase